MSSISIPLRPKNEADFPQLKKIDKQIIAAAVLLQLDNQSAFALYHPEYIDGTGRLNAAGKQASKMFWGYGKAKDYRQAFEETVEEFLNGRKRTAKSDAVSIDDSRKDRALKSLLNQAMSMVEGGADLDADTLKTITEIFKKLNILKDEVEQEIRPIRFLPTLCASECRYRLFVENAVKGGDLVDECQYCRALRFATENGYHDDATKRLDIPQEILDAEPENTVSTLDILSGKIKN